MDRIWYGGGSLRSIRWAADHGLNLLTGNIVSGEGTDDFGTAQLALVEEYRRRLPPGRPGRVALGRVVVPLDSASAVTRDRDRRYAAGRHERTLRPQGERRTLFAPDLVGPADEIVARLAARRAGGIRAGPVAGEAGRPTRQANQRGRQP